MTKKAGKKKTDKELEDFLVDDDVAFKEMSKTQLKVYKKQLKELVKTPCMIAETMQGVMEIKALVEDQAKRIVAYTKPKLKKGYVSTPNLTPKINYDCKEESAIGFNKFAEFDLAEFADVDLAEEMAEVDLVEEPTGAAKRPKKTPARRQKKTAPKKSPKIQATKKTSAKRPKIDAETREAQRITRQINKSARDQYVFQFYYNKLDGPVQGNPGSTYQWKKLKELSCGKKEEGYLPMFDLLLLDETNDLHKEIHRQLSDMTKQNFNSLGRKMAKYAKALPQLAK